jgi:23S rRNA pseudouridine2605 synthase
MKTVQRERVRQRMRLNRFLAMAGLGSRRTCDDLIAAGEIKVNGETVTQMGVRIDPEFDTVTFRGREIDKPENFIYILMNKPNQTVTTVKDEKHRRTVIDVVNIDERIYPVGRLDYNTTGALLLTNDGDLAYFLAHPRFNVSKIYRTLLNKRIRPIDLHHFRKGIELDGTMTAPCRAEEIRILNNASYLEIEIHEGRNRQIRRMFQALGYHVEELHRVNFAGLKADDLKPGEWRRLSDKEIKNLKHLIKDKQAQEIQHRNDEE